MEALYYTISELASRERGDIPQEMSSANHLIYSSPAALAFNSPGAEGFGVKRAGLSVPDSVMLIVSPGCCGRNTSSISRMPGYEDRFFYLVMDETDLVTGRHLKKIPRAVLEICRGLEERGKLPRVVMICITCVDALLGTDMERVCRRSRELVQEWLDGIGMSPVETPTAERSVDDGQTPSAGYSGQVDRSFSSGQEAAGGRLESTGSEASAGKKRTVRVRPCYMYALTREGRKPPMVHVRQSIYELLEPRRRKSSSVNLLGFFAPLRKESELSRLLFQAGVRAVRQIGACGSYEEFQKMAEANFNLVLNPEARPAAYDLQKRLGIPFIELRRFYQTDRIKAQYTALARALGTDFDDRKWEEEAREAVENFRRACPDSVFSVGEAMNGDPFELACALVREGFPVREIFGTLSADSWPWIRILASLSPETRVYSNLHPTMLHYRGDEGDGIFSESTGFSALGKNCARDERDAARSSGKITITIGRDAGWYHPGIPNVQWNTDLQPYGYGAVTGLFRALLAAVKERSEGSFSSSVLLGKSALPGDSSPSDSAPAVRETASQKAEIKKDAVSSKEDAYREEKEGRNCGAGSSEASTSVQADRKASARNSEGASVRGFRRHATPFAPDQSGAVSVLFDLGAICVVCDAGGCTGNICGFDEPRWFGERSAVFSAGLRDMDAILGRDDRLVEKLALAASQIPAEFAAIVGTPVPAVIGTDYRALRRLASKKTGLPVIGIDTNGMEYYDKGMEKAYLALLETFCRKNKKESFEEKEFDTRKEKASAEEELPCTLKEKAFAEKELLGSLEKKASAEEALPCIRKEKASAEAELPCTRKEKASAEEALLISLKKKDSAEEERFSTKIKKDPAEKNSTEENRVYLFENARRESPAADPFLGEKDGKKVGETDCKAAVWGFSPLDFSGLLSAEEIRTALKKQGYGRTIIIGAGEKLSVFEELPFVKKNIVVSPAGAAAAKWLEKRFGTPWEYMIPGGEELFDRFLDSWKEKMDPAASGFLDTRKEKMDPGPSGFVNSWKEKMEPAASGLVNTWKEKMDPGPSGFVNSWKEKMEPVPSDFPDNSLQKKVPAPDSERILVLHQQVLASFFCSRLRNRGWEADAAGFFLMDRALLKSGDSVLREEDDLFRLVRDRGYRFVIADESLAPILKGLPAAVLHLPHFAVSG